MGRGGREEQAGRGGGKSKNQTKEISIFSNLSAWRETPQRPFLSKTWSSKLESAAQLCLRWGQCSENSSPALKQGVQSWKELQISHWRYPICLGKDVVAQLSLPTSPSTQVKQQREKLAGRRALHASWNQPALSVPIFYPRAPLEIPADTAGITYYCFTSTLAILYLNGLSPLYPSTAGAK